MSEQLIHNVLMNFSHSLIIPDRLIEESNQYRQFIFELLQNKSRYSVDRCRLAGGAAKKTSLSFNFDLDCVIYINDQEPPFEKILDEWEDILTLAGGNQIKGLRCTRHSVQFTFKGYNFDVLPAPNYADHNQNLYEQAKMTWERIRTNQTNRSKDICGQYSSGLSELAVEFLKKRSAFIHDLCRLAKFWNCTVHFDGYVSGRSSIIEALAVKAGEEEEKAAINGTLSILRAFRRFLLLLQNYRGIGIAFLDMYPKGFLIPSYPKPFLIDSSNPFNNFLETIPKEFLPQMASYAKETLSRLDRCQINPAEELLTLFYPQPSLFQLYDDERINLKSVRTAISIRAFRAEKFPDLIIRRETFDKRSLDNIKELITCVIKYIHAKFCSEPREMTNEKVLNATQHFIDDSVYERQNQWRTTSTSHEDYDLTFIIPLNTANNEAVFISMSK